MPSEPGEPNDRVELLQGTLELIVLRALSTMGPQHAYGLAARLDQVADHPFPLNQGTLYAALVRLEQKGWIKGAWHMRRGHVCIGGDPRVLRARTEGDQSRPADGAAVGVAGE